MTLIEQYEAAIKRAEIANDPSQRELLSHFQRISDDLTAAKPRWFKRKRKSIMGLYLSGPVGVGKTYLLDLFYENLPGERKARFHFHQFMQQIDAQLRRLQGQKDPLRRIAANLAKAIRVICLDEFLVHDVADAMILAELLQALFAEGMVLVATSNTKPDDLYRNGVQRDRFLPAIALIKQHCQILALGEHCDYRLGRSPLHQAYLYPLDYAAEQALTEQFAGLAETVQEGIELTIQNRQIPTVKCSERAVWFDFDVICHLPRSQLDYLEIADRFDTVFLSGVPRLSVSDTSSVILFIHFIDVMYDRGIRLVISAAVPLNELYVAGEKIKAFERTLSRLEEMQSEDYLTRHQRR